MAKPKTTKRGANFKRKPKEDDQDDSVVVTPALATVGQLKAKAEGRTVEPAPVEVARYDVIEAKFYQIVNIQHKDAFTLQPTVVPDGALAGKQVIILEPIKQFPFLDLPAELRTMVYNFVFPVGRMVRMAKRKPGLKSAEQKTEDGNTTCLTLKMKHPQPSALDLLRVSKQVLEECAPVAYDNHVFLITETTKIGLFLQNLGGMVRYVKHIDLTRNSTYDIGSFGYHIAGLSNATALRDITFDHEFVCYCNPAYGGGKIRPNHYEGIVDILAPILKAIAQAQEPDSNINVLDVVRVQGPPSCWHCNTDAPERCILARTGSWKQCGEVMDGHCSEVRNPIRTLLAKKLGMEE